MSSRTIRIDLIKLAVYYLKRSWVLILCALIGFVGLYWQASSRMQVTYTAYGTMYVYNGNPNMINYGYTSSGDLNSAIQLLDTYMVVVRSNKVMDAVTERLAPSYPGITSSYIASTLAMGSVSETGVLRVSCMTDNAQKSADICNAVMDVAPTEIIRVVGAGNIEIIDYATPPLRPDARSAMRAGIIGGLIGLAAAAVVLLALFLFGQRITSARELTDNYTPPLLSSIRRDKRESDDPGVYVLNEQSAMEDIENYAKLRMNLMYTLMEKEKQIVEITSAISGEGKSTVAASLAFSCVKSGKRVLLIDADLRRACQRDIFHYDKKLPGLCETLMGNCKWQDALIQRNGIDILPAGHQPPNPAEMMESLTMKHLLKETAEAYDLVLLDVPPINIVSDPLALSSEVAGSIFVVRQNYSQHKEVRRALIAAEMTGMHILGFVFSGENVTSHGYYHKKYYQNYYHKYDTRQPAPDTKQVSGYAKEGANKHESIIQSWIASTLGNDRSHSRRNSRK